MILQPNKEMETLLKKRLSAELCALRTDITEGVSNLYPSLQPPLHKSRGPCPPLKRPHRNVFSVGECERLNTHFSTSKYRRRNASLYCQMQSACSWRQRTAGPCLALRPFIYFAIIGHVSSVLECPMSHKSKHSHVTLMTRLRSYNRLAIILCPLAMKKHDPES